MFARLLAGTVSRFRTYRVVEGQFPASVTECDGWLITGSRHGAYEDHPWIPPLEDFIRDAYAAHVPDGRHLLWPPDHRASHGRQGREVTPAAGRLVPPITISTARPCTLNAWHRDQVTESPANAKVLATNDFCTNAALAL